VVQVVLGMTAALAKDNIDVTVFAPISKQGKTGQYPGVKIKFFKQPFFSPLLAGKSLWSGYSPALAKALKKQARNFDVIHSHSMWHYPHLAAYQAAIAANKPFVSTVQGELTPWALSKQSSRGLHIQKQILKHASAIQAVSPKEAEYIKNFSGNKNIFVVPNGINPEDFDNTGDSQWLFRTYPQLKGKKIILYLGRINDGKGLEVLARSFSKVAAREPNSRLLIVGPDEWGFGKKIKEILKQENALDKTVFTGMLAGEKKLSALRCSNAFVLLSESEAFSITILEALYCGLSVIISPECNFPEVENSGAGRIIAKDADQLTNTLLELLANPATVKDMGIKGKNLIQSGGYYYDSIAKKIIETYGKIIR